MNYRYVFWDNDGVLVDTERYYLQASREALARIGIALSDAEFLAISLTEGRSLFDLARAQGASDATIGALQSWRSMRYAELLEIEDLSLAGAGDVLQQLHGRVKMAIVTSSQKHHFHIIHKRTGFLGFFDFVLTREDYTHSKPSAEPYLLALQRSGLDPEHVVAIEDSPRGLKSAKAAGLACWALPGPHAMAADFAAADCILGSILEVPELLL